MEASAERDATECTAVDETMLASNIIVVIVVLWCLEEQAVSKASRLC